MRKCNPLLRETKRLRKCSPFVSTERVFRDKEMKAMRRVGDEGDGEGR